MVSKLDLPAKQIKLNKQEYRVCQAIDYLGTTDFPELLDNVSDRTQVSLNQDQLEETLKSLQNKGFLDYAEGPQLMETSTTLTQRINDKQTVQFSTPTITQTKVLDITLSPKGTKAFYSNVEYHEAEVNFWAGNSS